MIKFIDEATPDENRFKAVKALFLKSISEDSSQEEQIIAYQFMKLSAQLDSDALLILKAAHDICNGDLAQTEPSFSVDLGTKNASAWLTAIATQIGHNILSLVELHEDQLVQYKLLGPRQLGDNSGIQQTGHFRLTDLGFRFCEYVYNT